MTQIEKYRREWARLFARRRLDAFERALLDPELVSMKQELVKLDMRISDLEERAKKGESRGAWHHVKAFAKEILRTCGSETDLPDLDKMRDLATRLEACAHQGLDDFAVWDELKELIELRRKISDTERKYEELHKLLIPAAELGRMFDDLHAAIEQHVLDRVLQRAIFNEVRMRLNGDRKSGSLIPAQLPAAFVAADAPTHTDAGDDPVSVETE